MNRILWFRKPTKIVQVIIFLLVAAVAAVTAQSAITQQIEVKHDRGTWSYTTKPQQHDSITAWIQSNDNSVAGLKQYAETNKALAVELAKTKAETRVDITFRKAVDVDTYRDWAKTSGISYFSQVILWGVDQNNKVSTMMIGSSSNDPLPKTTLNNQVASAKQDGTVFNSLGVVQVRARAESSTLAALANDPLVFLAEVTPNIVIQELRANGATDADIDRADILNMTPLFFVMNQLGLENFR